MDEEENEKERNEHSDQDQHKTFTSFSTHFLSIFMTRVKCLRCFFVRSVNLMLVACG